MDGAGAVVLAVAAGAVDLAVVLGVEVDDVDVTAAVVLYDLVVGVEGTAADDLGVAVALDGDGVLADVLEPDVLESAGADTVDTLVLVGANDDVPQGSAILKDEDGVGLAALRLATALDAAVVLEKGRSDAVRNRSVQQTYLDPLGIEGLALLDVLGLAERLGVGVLRQTTVMRQAGEGGGQSSQESDEAGRVHFAGRC